MRISNEVVNIILLLLISLKLFGQSSDVTFKKSPTKYRIESYIYEDINGDQQVVDFKISYKRSKTVINTGVVLNSISFGCHQRDCYELIGFSGDTVFHFQLLNIKKPLFILNEKTRKDTLFISEFCAIHKHYVLFNKRYYYNAIKDTVYEFALWHDRDSHFSKSAEDNYFYFNRIAINKSVGFVWINYRYHGAEVEIRYY